MTAVHRYEGFVFDSSRWEGFELRPGDVGGERLALLDTQGAKQAIHQHELLRDWFRLD